MRLLAVLLLLAASGALSAPEAQPLEPGDGFEWQRLGATPFESLELLTFDSEGQLWGAGVTIDYPRNLYVYDEDADTWRDTTNLGEAPYQFLFLSPDTLLAGRVPDIDRSTDGGETWEEVYEAAGTDVLLAAPFGLPRSGGRIFTNDIPTDRLAYSTDRGRRFTVATYDPALFGTDDIRTATALVVTRGPHAGRVIEGALHGLSYSDDGGESFRPSSLWELYRFRSRELVEGESTEGESRLFALVTDATSPWYHAVYSDDGGATWSEPVPLPEIQDGVGARGELVWLGPVGQPQSVVAVLPRGHIYRTDDAGATWQLKGRAPVPESAAAVRGAVVDIEGRLIVTIPHNGTPTNGVFRTVLPLPVSGETGPEDAPEASGVRLSVAPNPTGGPARVTVTLARPAQDLRVTVVDARGRAVVQVASGARGAGEHMLSVETRSLPPGVYTVRASADGVAVATARLTVVR